MSKIKTPKPAKTGKKARAPFTERFTKRIEKLKSWVDITQKKFATAPNDTVSKCLEEIGEAIEGIAKGLPALKDWTPPSRSPAFAVGDFVEFKKDKFAELLKTKLYEKAALEGEHEVMAVAGRKVKIGPGVFANTLITKAKG